MESRRAMVREGHSLDSFYKEVEGYYTIIKRPGLGKISDATNIQLAPGGREAVFVGSVFETLERKPATRICSINLSTGETEILTYGAGEDRTPAFSPDGRSIAFLSDRERSGDFQLYLLELKTRNVRPAGAVDGWVESFQWSLDGSKILMGVAGHGADTAGAQGAVATDQFDKTASWAPTVESGGESYRWRSVWIYEITSDRVNKVSISVGNCWEAVWCGDCSIVAVTSTGPDEGDWYDARLSFVDLNSGEVRTLFRPGQQIGCPAVSPSGTLVAIIEAVCSDRGLVAGDLRIVDYHSGKIVAVETAAIDITYATWQSDRHLLVAGHRGFETVVGVYHWDENHFEECWASTEISTGGRYIAVSAGGVPGDCVLIGEGFARSPEIAEIKDGKYRTIKSLDLGYTAIAKKAIAGVECLRWKAPDGLEIQGWFLKPSEFGPHPMVMNVHGGPVWLWHPMSLSRSRYVPLLMLLARGYAIFLPNPRGSSSRGQPFAREVVGDMGGADTHDFLSGIDHLVGLGRVDPERLGVTGVSYGGFMAAWLVTQDSRFAAAVAVAPVTNRVSQRLLCSHPHFVDMFLADRYDNPAGKYFNRSPIMHAHKCRTPTLSVCGALDRCTPPEEAKQFHNAIRENGVVSSLVTYPEEGHGIQGFPASLDYAARVVQWFDRHVGGYFFAKIFEGSDAST